MCISDPSGPDSYFVDALVLDYLMGSTIIVRNLILSSSELQLVDGIDENKTFAFNMGSE